METSYAARLKRARSESGLSQAELARRCGLKPQAVQYLEEIRNAAQGSKHTPSFARELAVSANWLASGQGPMKATDTAAPTLIATPAQILAAIRSLRPELQRSIAQIVLELAASVHSAPARIPLASSSEPRRLISSSRRRAA